MIAGTSGVLTVLNVVSDNADDFIAGSSSVLTVWENYITQLAWLAAAIHTASNRSTLTRSGATSNPVSRMSTDDSRCLAHAIWNSIRILLL